MPRSPLRVGVTELRRRPGTQRPVAVVATLPDLVITTARVPADAELRVDAVLEAIDGAITVRGHLHVPWTGACRRCLEDVAGELDVELQEVFEARPTSGDTYLLEGDEVDLEPMVRDSALLHLPLAPLCREDCRGPAPEAFPALRADEAPEADDEGGPSSDAGRAEPLGDPRWAALDVLKAAPAGDDSPDDEGRR